MEIGVFAHGPQMDNDALAQSCTLQGCPNEIPPTYVSASITSKVFAVDSINTTTWRAKAKLVAWTDAPSTQYNVRDQKGPKGKVVAMLVADGVPTAPVQGVTGPQGQTDYSRGGVTAVYADKTIKIFPSPTIAAEFQVAGRVVNTVQCHEGSGICWFSVWKFYGKKADWDPDCLWWCVLDDFKHPTKCIVGGVMNDAKGRPFCHNSDSGDDGGVDGTTIGGGVHGFGKGHEKNLNAEGTEAIVDLFLVYTGGSDFTRGVSWIRKVTIHLNRRNGTDATQSIIADAPWGSDLWEDTIANHSTQDVGCDHAWMDLSKQNVWVTTFRQPNDGIHLLDYATGRLIHSYHGMAKQRVPNPGGPFYYANYSYSAGVSGRGVTGTPNSIVTFATSENMPTRYAPNPGRGSLWWADVSAKYPRFGSDGVLR